MTTENDEYTPVALEQLEALTDDVYNAALDVIETVFAGGGRARSAHAIQTAEGVRLAINVPGHFPYKVFWSEQPDGPRIEAVFTYEF